MDRGEGRHEEPRPRARCSSSTASWTTPSRGRSPMPRTSSRSATPGVTEIVKVEGRGHALTIDNGWREVADTVARVHPAVRPALIAERPGRAWCVETRRRSSRGLMLARLPSADDLHDPRPGGGPDRARAHRPARPRAAGRPDDQRVHPRGRRPGRSRPAVSPLPPGRAGHRGGAPDRPAHGLDGACPARLPRAAARPARDGPIDAGRQDHPGRHGRGPGRLPDPLPRRIRSSATRRRSGASSVSSAGACSARALAASPR